MFFFRRKNKNRPIPAPVSPPAPKEFVYYLRKDFDADGILLSLSHSSEPYCAENADGDDFTAISREILEGAFSELWVSAWVWDRMPCYFVLPDGHRCIEKRIFSQVFQQYAKSVQLPHPVLVKEDGRIVLFSHGFFSPFFSSYMSDMSEMLDVLGDFYDREMDVYGYKQPFEPGSCYDEEKRRVESASWDMKAFFDELHDNLLLFIRDPHETERIASLVHQACEQYGKELRIIHADDSI